VDPADRPPLLRFDSVSVTVASGAALLVDVDAQVDAGSITVLAGPSGAGKSTLLRLGDRLEVPTSGRVLLEGVDIVELDPRELRRTVGMVFQRPVLFPGTVADNLGVAQPQATSEAMAAVLDSVGLRGDFLDRTGDDLSGGEAQRVCIARALLTEPKVLLMDEPTSSLDPASRSAVEELVRGLADHGLGIAWVTHDHSQAIRLADQVVVLRNGHKLSRPDAESYLMFGEDGGER
jgi:putative ABC transport system ATP-binding protein